MSTLDESAERLVAAIRSGDQSGVSTLVDAGANPNYREPATGLTPLMIAAGRGDAKSVRLLLDGGADVFTVDGSAGASVLHHGCRAGSLEVVRLLVDAGAFIDSVAPTTGHTPLVDALWFKHPEIVRYLLDLNAGVNIGTHYGFSVLDHFVYERDVDADGTQRQLQAERYVRERIARDEECAASRRLIAAAAAGDVARVRNLIAEGVPVDERYPVVNGFNDGHTALLIAARDGHTGVAEVLLAAGADVNATEPTFGAAPLHKSVYNGHLELTRLIAGWPGVDLDIQGATNGYTPLHDALWHGHPECAEAVLDAGAGTSILGYDGKTPLTLAIEVFGAGHAVTKRIQRR